MGNLGSCPIHHQVFGLKGAWAAPLKKSITSPNLSSISIQMPHSGQLCPVPLSPHLSMFSLPSHIQYQFESPVEHFLPLDITGLSCISAATQKFPQKPPLPPAVPSDSSQWGPFPTPLAQVERTGLPTSARHIFHPLQGALRAALSWDVCTNMCIYCVNTH